MIAGASGLIGNTLCRLLEEERHEIVVLSRRPQAAREKLGDYPSYFPWLAEGDDAWKKEIAKVDGVVNLAGENVGSGYWTKTKKARILQSRLKSAQALVEAIKAAPVKPAFYIQASAIGYYGDGGENWLDEETAPGGGFLSDVIQKLEGALQPLNGTQTRVSIIRSGVVLSPQGGALRLMALPFRFFVGGPVGSGRQWISWIHLRDEVRAICFIMEHGNDGVYNLTTPTSCRQKTFSNAIAKAVHRPSWLPAPAFAMKWALGDMADEMLLVSQRVWPRRLLKEKFEFDFVDIEQALINLLR